MSTYKKLNREQELAKDCHSDISAEIDYALIKDILGDREETLIVLRSARNMVDEWIEVLEKME